MGTLIFRICGFERLHFLLYWIVFGLYLSVQFVTFLAVSFGNLLDQDEFLAKIRKIVIIWASFTDRELSGCVGLSVDDEEKALTQKIF